MRLLYSAGSPFARTVRIALLETGLDPRVTKQEVTRARLYSVRPMCWLSTLSAERQHWNSETERS